MFIGLIIALHITEERFEDKLKRKSKTDRKCNVQKEIKRTNNDLQYTTRKTKDRATRTPQKTEGELRFSGKEVELLEKYTRLNSV